jgi:bud emergence protein 1
MNQQRSGRGSAQQQLQPYRSSQQQQQQQQQQPRLPAPISASLPRYCFDNDMYWYIIECQMEDGRHWELSRYYADFYDFQIALLEHFPEEAGNKGKPRTLPFMPGPVAHVTDAISNGRRQSLDEYIRKILSMPPHISKSQLVRQLFAPRPGDFEIDPNALGDDYRLSGASQQSSQNEASYSASRQSSNSQVNGAGGYGGMYPPGHPSHQRGPPVPQMGGPFLRNEASTLTQASATSSNKAANPGGAMKVKVFFQEDIIAIRVPSDIAFQPLKDKLRDRLKINEDIAIQYRDEPTNTLQDLDDDNDLETALQQNPKLTLTVNFAS